MLKVAIWPSFINKSLFELKYDSGAWNLLVTKESFGVGDFKDPGNIWISHHLAAGVAEQLIVQSKEIIDHPKSDLRVILDGVSVKLTLKEGKEEFQNKFSSPLPHSKEQHFIFDLIELTKTSISNTECHNYLELLEQYFFDVSPIKELNHTNYRLKLIGGLSINDKDDLKAKFSLLSTKKNPTVDMTNFLTTGRALDECFLDIQKIEGLTVLVNNQARFYLSEIGFDSTKILPGSNEQKNKGIKT
jgi:hypothetical protein